MSSARNPQTSHLPKFDPKYPTKKCTPKGKLLENKTCDFSPSILKETLLVYGSTTTTPPQNTTDYPESQSLPPGSMKISGPLQIAVPLSASQIVLTQTTMDDFTSPLGCNSLKVAENCTTNDLPEEVIVVALNDVYSAHPHLIPTQLPDTSNIQ